MCALASETLTSTYIWSVWCHWRRNNLERQFGTTQETRKRGRFLREPPATDCLVPFEVSLMCCFFFLGRSAQKFTLLVFGFPRMNEEPIYPTSGCALHVRTNVPLLLVKSWPENLAHSTELRELARCNASVCHVSTRIFS